MAESRTGTVIIHSLVHEVATRRSFVRLTWPDDPERSLGLPIPYGCSLDDLPGETEKALRALVRELGEIVVNTSTP